jgi:hypothetical protein
MVEALGGKGLYVTEPGQLRPALERALGSGEVYCVNVVLDPAAYRRTGQVSMAIGTAPSPPAPSPCPLPLRGRGRSPNQPSPSREGEGRVRVGST